MKAASAFSSNPDWEKAITEALVQTKSAIGDAPVHLALVFINSTFQRRYGDILARVRAAANPEWIAGCSGYGVVGRATEIEGRPAVSLLLLSLPDAVLSAAHLTQGQIEEANGPAFWHLETGVLPDDVNAWLLFADPFQTDCERLLRELNEAYPDKPVAGGLASAMPGEQTTHLFLNDRVFNQGAVGVAIGGAVTLLPVVCQGCTPIGEPWTITRAERNIIHEIGSQPAFQVLVNTVQALPPALQKRAQHNLFIGLVLNEYQEQYQRGDFLIRNLLGVDPQSGAIAVAALPRVGQTLQFQLRDAQAADEEIRAALSRLARRTADAPPLAGLLCCCNGRGTNLFEVPHHDAGAVAETFRSLPLTGFFCNGEIGPVANKNYLHGFSALLALFVKKAAQKQGANF
jgi:small ligand-binding sensory domain FIST